MASYYKILIFLNCLVIEFYHIKSKFFFLSQNAPNYSGNKLFFTGQKYPRNYEPAALQAVRSDVPSKLAIFTISPEPACTHRSNQFYILQYFPSQLNSNLQQILFISLKFSLIIGFKPENHVTTEQLFSGQCSEFVAMWVGGGGGGELRFFFNISGPGFPAESFF